MIHTETWRGSGGGGVPLLLVHGLGCSTVVWNLAGPALAAATGSDVTALDLPGFGKTPPAPGRVSLSGYARVVDEMAADLGGAVVVGNSMGGAIALRAAQSDSTAVKGLVLVAPALMTGGGSVATRAKFAFMATPGVGPAAVGLLRARRGPVRSVDLRLRALLHCADDVPSAFRDELVAEAGRNGRAAARVYSAATRAIGFEAAQVWAGLRSVTCPTLVVHGRDDPLVPVALVERLRAERDDWAYEIYEDCGHWPQVEHPERLAASVGGWLA